MRAWTLIVVCRAFLCAFVVSAHAADTFQAGAATSNITPDVGQEIIGGFVPFPSKHVHDELHARCLVLDDGKTKLAFVVCDLLGLHRIVGTEGGSAVDSEESRHPAGVRDDQCHAHAFCQQRDGPRSAQARANVG